jgi:hypothetical protein
MITFTEEEIRTMSTARLKIIVQPFFHAYHTATQILVRWELLHREHVQHMIPRMIFASGAVGCFKAGVSDRRFIAVDSASEPDSSVCVCPSCCTVQIMIGPEYKCNECNYPLIDEELES